MPVLEKESAKALMKAVLLNVEIPEIEIDYQVPVKNVQRNSEIEKTGEAVKIL